MRISSILSVVCVASLCLGGAAVRAADTEAEARAREALRQKMRELQAQPQAQASKPASQVGQVVTPSPVVSPAAQAAPAYTPRTDSDAIARARAALRQKLNEPAAPAPPPTAVRAQTPAPIATPVQTDSDAIARTRAALRQKLNEPAAPATSPIAAPAPAPVAPAMSPIATPAPAPVAPAMAPIVAPVRTEPDAIAKARMAVRQKLEELEAQEPIPVVEPVVAEPVQTKIKPVRKTAAPAGRAEAERQALKTSDAFRPLEAPPSSLSASKETRLAELLQRYKADQITPQEYHTQRAAILAEP